MIRSRITALSSDAGRVARTRVGRPILARPTLTVEPLPPPQRLDGPCQAARPVYDLDPSMTSIRIISLFHELDTAISLIHLCA